MKKYREEKDSIGKKLIPDDAYYGVQSMRAAENFKITGSVVHSEFIKSIAEVKLAAAISNRDAKIISENKAEAIILACQKIIEGQYRENFIVDSIQGGAGTSFNMNANEVVANIAIEILGGKKGDYCIVHPNDDVNCGQSTNDVYPSAGKIALIRLLNKAIDELEKMYKAFIIKGEEYSNIIKMGRTEMQDAVPISFGQSFNAYASAISRDILRFQDAIKEMSVLNMGGTAIGTCINADDEYVKNIVPNLSKITKLELSQAEDLIDATQNLDSFVYVSGIVKACASTLSKISNDFRLMSSGPRTGFGEITLPPKQNGSSIMPGKINPVIPEVVNQIAFNIIGNDVTITMAAEAGQLELNAFEPVIFHCLFESVETLINGIRVFTSECLDGLTVNSRECENEVERSVGIATALCPYIGYSESSRLAKKALKENRNIKDVVSEEKISLPESIGNILNPRRMI